MYYQRFGKDAEPEFANLVRAINLQDYLYKVILVRFRTGELADGLVLDNLHNLDYPVRIRFSEFDALYTIKGRYVKGAVSEEDIIAIEEVIE